MSGAEIRRGVEWYVDLRLKKSENSLPSQLY